LERSAFRAALKDVDETWLCDWFPVMRYIFEDRKHGQAGPAHKVAS
jgi:hypothetical protein